MKDHSISYSTNNGIDKRANPAKWELRRGTVYDLAADVYRGHPFTSVFRNNERCKANFVESWFVALDFDCQDERASFDILLQNDTIREFGSFMYYTPSSKPPAYKSRVVFALVQPARSVTEYEEIQKAITWMFPDSDQSTAEAARLFYGSKGRDLHPLWGALPIEAAREFIRHWEWEKPDVAPALPTIKQAAGDVRPEALQAKADALLKNVKDCEDGKKYCTLRDMATTFGGYVAGGYYDKTDVTTWLRSAIDTRNVRSSEHAYKTIDESLAYGMARPLYFERRANG
jgi:hypothetical protein